jgi:hypothetical protein
MRAHCPEIKVYPSGFARATRAEAMVPPAPTAFSMTTGCPSRRDMLSGAVRDITSTAPPAANGTTSTIGRLGYSCSATARALDIPTPAQSRVVHSTCALSFMIPPSGLAAPPGRAALSPQICTPTHTMQLVILTGLSVRPPGLLLRDPRHHNCIILMNYAKRP